MEQLQQYSSPGVGVAGMGWDGMGAGRAPGKAGPPRVEGSSWAPSSAVRERAWGAWAARLHTSS